MFTNPLRPNFFVGITKFAIILLLGIIVFSSCKKDHSENEYVHEGIVMRFPARQPASGIKVYLLEFGFVRLLHPNEEYWTMNSADTVTTILNKKIDSTTSDQNGKFSFVVKKPAPNNPDGTFRPFAEVISKDYIRVYSRSLAWDPSRRVIDTQFIATPSTLKLHVQKLSNIHQEDTFIVKQYPLFQPGFATFATFSKHGRVAVKEFNLENRYSFDLSNKVKVEWRYYNRGLRASGADTVTLLRNSVVNHDIRY